MKKDNLVYLEDIQDSIAKIDQYTKELNFDGFAGDEMCQDAVIRHLEIIGEAANKISTDFLQTHPNLVIKPAIGMRNMLIHGYDQVDDETVWQTIQESLPTLNQQIKTILGTETS